MPKSSKKFVIVSNQVNNYGYRVETAGMDLTQYEKNPILLFMHTRAFSNSTDQVLPLGHIQDLKLEQNGDITGSPFFSDSDEFAMQVFNKVEDGTYRMCSAGFEAIETSDDPDQLMQGQRYATVTKSKLKEVSIVDIGGDDNALCLFHEGNLLRLDDANDTSKIIPSIKNLNNTKMKEQLIPMLLLVGLTQDGTPEQLMAKLTELKQKADEADTHAATIITLNDTIGTLQKAAIDSEVDAVVDAAFNARKITEAQKPFYKQMGETNIENLKQLFDSMPTVPTLQSLTGDTTSDANDPILKLSYKEAHTSGKLAEVKQKYPEHYKTIFKSHFGREPKA